MPSTSPPLPPVISTEIIQIANSEQCKRLMPISERRTPDEKLPLPSSQSQKMEILDLSNISDDHEKHNAEKLVEESTNACRRNVFQFDTLHTDKLEQSTSKSPMPSSPSLVNPRGEQILCYS